MRGISLRLFKVRMVLVAVMLAVLWLFQVVFLENFYSTRQIRLMEDKVTGIAARIAEKGSDDPELRAEMTDLAEVYNLVIGIYDDSGASLFEAGRESSTGTSNFFDKHMQDIVAIALLGESVTKTEEQTRTGGRFLVLAIPAGDGVVASAVPLAPVVDTVSILKVQLGYVTVILLAVSFLLSLILSKRFVKPILKISGASRAIAKGDFSWDLDVEGDDEIADLARDINEMGQELGRTERLRKDLIGNISHELRTPLSLIRGYAETLRDVTGNDPGKRNKQLGIIIGETERLARLVDDILSMSRLDSGAAKPDLGVIDLSELAVNIAERFRDLSARTGIRLELVVGEGCRIMADRKYLEQVVVNLLGNAFTHANQSITVTVSKRDGLVELSVEDDGAGIRTEDLPRIWDRYYKGSDESSKGTGLGLAIVKSILESHGFSYGASNNQAGGARFHFSAKAAERVD